MYYYKVAGATMLFWAVLLFYAAIVFANEEAVRTEFADIPVMIDIARCESKFTQFNTTGEPLHGGYQSKMIGVFQIYEDIHAAYAQTLGMDITTLEGNLAYARLLYNREGTQPWMSSFPCWGKEATTTLETGSGALSANLSFGMEHPQVLMLQKLLNARGYLIAVEGPRSPGNETLKFGFLTRDAVRKFQCTEMQLCEGDEYSNGYGFVGSKTRGALVRPKASTASSQAKVETSTATTYSESQLKEIVALQAQIADLTRILQGLIAARGL